MRRRLVCWQNLVSVSLVGFFLLVAVAAPVLAPPDDPENPTPFRVLWENLEPNPIPPSRDVILGTVRWQRGDESLHFDVYHSVVWGTRAAIRFGLVTALVTATIGSLVGLTSGYLGGRYGALAMRITDAFLAVPMIAGVWLFHQLFRDAYDQMNQATWFAVGMNTPVRQTLLQRLLLANWLDPVMFTFILFSWMPYARLINAVVLKAKRSDYVLAAQSLGATSTRTMFRHLLPNVIAPAIVLAARDVGALVILQTAFSFVGVSGAMNIQWQLGQWFSPVPEWARLLVLGRTWVIGAYGNPLLHWWTYLPPTVALILFGIGWNMLGDRLNVVLNPRST